jgi:hypothetical protein
LGFIEPGCDAPELFQSVEHALYTIAILVCLEVAGRRVLPVRFRRNDWLYSVYKKLLSYVVTIITLVGQKQSRLGNWHGEQVWHGDIIRSLAARQDEAKRASLTICAGVDFCRKAAA